MSLPGHRVVSRQAHGHCLYFKVRAQGCLKLTAILPHTSAVVVTGMLPCLEFFISSFKTGSYCIALADLELTMQTRLLLH